MQGTAITTIGLIGAGHIPEVDDEPTTTSGLVQAHLLSAVSE